MKNWFSKLSERQKQIGALAVFILVGSIVLGIFYSFNQPKKTVEYTHSMTIKELASKLGVTGKSLARELGLPLDAKKNKAISELNISKEKLDHAVEHILSHVDATGKYFVFLGICVFALIFLVYLGRPANSAVKERESWFPSIFYLLPLAFSVTIAGFYFGKSPNPMEGAVKVFKSMVGLYPDPLAKVIAFLFFVFLAIIGNKIICGWACPYGALQELLFSIPWLKNIKKKKIPFFISNGIRTILFVATLLMLFGIVGGKKGFVIYHYLNPFNLFNFDFDAQSILIAVIVTLVAAVFTYRPFCSFICPFGFISWLLERISIFKVRIDHEKCVNCGACADACPNNSAKGNLEKKVLYQDCFSCGRCLNSCPVNAIHYCKSLPGEQLSCSENDDDNDDE